MMLIPIPHSGNFIHSVAIDAPPAGDWRAGYSSSRQERLTSSDTAIETSRMVLASAPRLTFTSYSSCSEINTWLEHLNRIQSTYYIHPVLITYTDARRKRNELLRISRGSLPEPFKSAELNDWRLPCTIGSVAPKVRTSGSILLFSAPIWNPAQLAILGRAPAFHTYVLVYKEGTLAIADPGYEWVPLSVGADGRERLWRLSELTYGCGLAAKFVRMLKGGRKVEKCWYGKAGRGCFDDTNGNVMSQEFILEYLEGWAGRVVDWEAEGFVELSL